LFSSGQRSGVPAQYARQHRIRAAERQVQGGQRREGVLRSE
jgi:hypothetical protein